MRARLLIGLFAVLGASCSVKEARQDCPCRLELDLSAFGEVARQVSLDLDGEAMERSLRSGDSLTIHTLLKARDRINVRVWSGVSRMKPDGNVLRVKAGEDSDSLFLFCGDYPGRVERAYVQAVPHKQFATVTLQLVSRTEGDPSAIRYTVRGEYGCIDLNLGTPVLGALNIPLPQNLDQCCFRLPRQKAGGLLVLEANDGKGNRENYSLGQWILDAGYDWNAQDLDDILVAADFVEGEFTVTVNPWIPGDALDHTL